MRDPYEILGLQRGASDADCKTAYRKLAMQYHPDRNPGDKAAEEKFKEISGAYDAITKPTPQQPNYNTQNNGNPFHAGPFNMDDIFKAFHAQQRQQNRDTNAIIEITLEDAFHGKDLNVSLTVGRDVRDINVRVPPGVDNGSRIRVPGAGDRSFPTLPPGDLYINIQVASHQVFFRRGKDVAMTIEIDAFDVMLGTKVGVVALDGKRLDVTIPANFQPKNQLRLAKQGMPILGTAERGDLIVDVQVRFPVLTQSQLDVIATLRSEEKL